MADQPDKEHAKEKEEEMKKKEQDELKDAVKSLDDEDEKRPGTDDDGTEENEK
ncbi:hypothetical protein [Paracoccus saliphilus]|uniref:Uncharacterized protein n=1 Tax=Paracoccus saliphilus TaxID=405559 RepID=A0AA46A4C0_9RHOB|nr:hypothetical protein [Paracoccus saliphilus]WCR03745.1 hypothetical protein JHX88_02965 [Paracoccus saliphilus]SIS58893.1 hypothetical protein SAMN05421772_101668 [Paracoccus saliphilus]